MTGQSEPRAVTGARPRVAVVGSGISGLTAAYLLRDRSDVTVFEAETRLGGHAHTHALVGSDGVEVFVDTGFIVHNRRTYPTLLRIFDELQVETQETEMSMSVRCDGCGLEYAGGRGLSGLLPVLGALGRPAYLRMLGEVVRFHRDARALLDVGDDGRALGRFLRDGRYSRYFIEHFALPFVSAVWSAGETVSLDYPAHYLFTFLHHHGLLSVTGSPTWRTVVGGSISCVRKIEKSLHAVRVATPVRRVARVHGGVEIRDGADTTHQFDGVVLATHPDQALGMLAAPTADEREILGAFHYSANETWLHSDTSVLPKARRARASWNYLKTRCAADDRVLVSYDMNRLQRLETPDDFVVTLNPGHRVTERSVVARMRYSHPIYTPSSVAAQAQLPALNDGLLAFAGAYHGWGFHEDGCASGVQAAASLRVARSRP